MISLMDLLMDLDATVQKLEYEPGDVFFLHLPHSASAEQLREWTDTIRDWLDHRGVDQVHFVAVPKDFVLTRASEAQMVKLGWVRANT